jgi:hypothetical protein
MMVFTLVHPAEETMAGFIETSLGVYFQLERQASLPRTGEYSNQH